MKKEKMLPTEYVDTVLFDIVREFYMQRGDGAKFRTVLVGRKYFEETLYSKVIVEKDFKKSLANLCEELPNTGMVEGLDIRVSRKDVPEYLLAGELVEAEVKGCVHLQLEKDLKKTGLYTYICPILNLITDVLEKAASSETDPGLGRCQRPVLLTQAGGLNDNDALAPMRQKAKTRFGEA